jgi:ethanolamine-phosphate cytidylyltransferase
MDNWSNKLKAKQLGDVLVVGVHSDEEILQNKGPTVLNMQERYVEQLGI